MGGRGEGFALKMLHRSSWLAVALTTALASAIGRADQTIAPNSPLIEAEGLCFASSTPTLLSLDRFSPAVLASPGGTFNPDNARTPACVILRFRTDSSFVRATFIETPGLNRGDDFSIYQNGAKTGNLTGLTLLINSVKP